MVLLAVAAMEPIFGAHVGDWGSRACFTFHIWLPACGMKPLIFRAEEESQRSSLRGLAMRCGSSEEGLV